MPTNVRIQELSPVGVQVHLIYIKTLTTCFLFLFFVLFFSPQLILQKSNDYFQRKLSLPRFQVGVQLFPMGGGGGSNCLFLIETRITCDFPRGPDPILLYLEGHIFF